MGKHAADETTGRLFVVATPIGNLKDLTLRAIETLGTVDVIAAEDTRHTRRLLAAHGIKGRLVSYHEHNEARRTSELIDRLKHGENVALVSDAGTPGVSDPGYRLVQAAIALKIPVVPVPGASAAIAALCASGLPTDNFTFVGFPARKKAKRMAQIADLTRLPHTLIFYQSPRRVKALLEELRDGLGDRRAVLAREVTKLHEEFLHGHLSEIEAEVTARGQVKGECTLLVAGAADVSPSEADLESAIAAALAVPESPSLSDMAKSLAKQFKVPRKMVYDKALKLQADERDGQ
jgi:16S rRNA (cytidine1402-2'-O)-methyltransferase